MYKRLILAVLAFVLVAANARAQGEAVLAVGLAVSSYEPGALGVGSTEFGPVIRLRLGTGLGPSIGFDWHGVGLNAVAGGQRIYVGRLRVRPVMGGITYNRKVAAAWTVEASLAGGYSFNRLTVSDRARSLFQAALGADSVAFGTTNSFVWRPRVALWYDAGTRVGVFTSLAYIGTRPTLSIATERGTYRSQADASTMVFTFGLVYGVF